MIQSLYYPISPYAFSILEPSVLGDIYELFLVEKIKIQDGKISLVKKEPNRNRDIVTTPYEIVKVMVDKALKPYKNITSFEDLLNLRFIDIACGSGVFLIELYDNLVKIVCSWADKNAPELLVTTSDERRVLNLDSKIEILTRCIYGIDIDPYAVEVTKFSLLLKLLSEENVFSLENKTNVLPMLNNNIKIGNSLIDKDMYKDTKDIQKRIKIYPFNWEFNNDTKLFDVIIGNPPYVTTEDMKNQLEPEEFKLYKLHYKSAFKQFDKYFIFIERALQKLKDGGKLIYLVPNKFTKIQSGEKLREIISNNKYLQSFTDFGSLQLFRKNKRGTKRITTYSSILELKKEEIDNFLYEKVTNKNDWINQYFEQDFSNQVSIPSTIITKESWGLAGDRDSQELFNKIFINSQPLDDVADVFNGIQTSAERPKPIYWFDMSEVVDENELTYTIQRNNKKYKLEKSILKPFFKPTKLIEKNFLRTMSLKQTSGLYFLTTKRVRFFHLMLCKKNTTTHGCI